MHALIVAIFVAGVSAYTWPSPVLDRLSTLRYDQSGGGPVNNVAADVVPCTKFVRGDTGRSNAADWIRTAYHDVATFNNADGSGGLDGSIQFELSRAENAGDGFENTINALAALMNRYVSLADAIALGLVFAIENCGGPQIFFQGGRVDATVANNPGVPQPFDSLATHTADFARQGFNATEMISLVACGHTFGGVQNAAFPTIVNSSAVTTADPDGNQPFDTTPTHFDNNIAVEYIGGTTQDPLVVGPNVTTRSDSRIFGSDGNVTMAAFASSADVFASTCESLLTRMINTVPASVTLTDIIFPLSAKPEDVQVIYQGSNVISVTGFVKFLDVSTSPPPAVTLNWDARPGSSGGTVATIPSATSSSPFLGPHQWYQYGTTGGGFTVPAAGGLVDIWYSLDNGAEFRNGPGNPNFPMVDTVMFASGTCIDVDTATLTLNTVIAVRKDVGTPTQVWVEVDGLNSFPAPCCSVGIDIANATAVSPQTPATEEYALYSAVAPFRNGGLVSATIGGVTYTSLHIDLLDELFPDC